MTEQEEDKRMWDEVAKANKALADSDKKFLSEAKRIRGTKFYNKVKKELYDDCSGFSHIEGIFEKPLGKPTDSDITEGLEIWVDQTLNGGYEGDSYAGTVDIKISEGKYLRYHYSM